MTTCKLSAHPYAQAMVLHYDNGDMALISYKTHVAGIENGWLFVNGLYSTTTRKHLSAWAREIGFDYALLKQLYNDDMVMNVETGEVISRADWGY